MTRTAIVAEHVAALRFGDLTESAVVAARRVILDLLGVALAGTRYGPGKTMRRYALRSSADPRATIIGREEGSSPETAALVNGTVASEMELDDVLEGMHPSTVHVPALLAIAEAVDATGEQLITGLVAAYEVGIRIGMALRMERVFARGFHPTSVCGVLGAAAGGASVLGLDARGVASALGLAASQSSGLLTWQGEPDHYAKSFQSGVAARGAVTAAELAALGYAGAPGALDGPLGVQSVFADDDGDQGLTGAFAAPFQIERTGYKFHTCCRAIHTSLDIVLELRAEHRFAADDVDSLRVWLPPFLVPVVDRNPLTTHDLQFILAVAIVDGEVTRAQTAAERRSDPFVDRLARRVELRPDPALETAPDKRIGPARIELRLTDGSTFRIERQDHRGGTTMPVRADEIERKFLRLSTQVLPDSAALALAEAVGHLDRLGRVSEMTSLLRTPVIASGDFAHTGRSKEREA